LKLPPAFVWQEPPTQTFPLAVQSVQLAPQCVLSVDRSTQLPLQLSVPGKQLLRQLLPPHTRLAPQGPQPPQCLGSFAVTTQTPAHDRLYSGHPHAPEMHSSFAPAGQSVADVHALPLPPPSPGPPEPGLPELPEDPDEPLLPRLPLDPASPASEPPVVIGLPSLPHATTTPTPSVKKTSW
jgi:hypothetical protein